MVTSGKGRMPHLQAFGRFLLLLAIPVAIGILMWFLARQAESRSNLVVHTLRVQLSLESLVADLKSVSSNHRGYLLTGQATFLQTYRGAVAASRQELSRLFSLTADDSHQQQILNQIRPLVETRFKDLESAQELFRAGKLDLAAIHVSTEDDKAHQSLVLGFVDEMYREDDRLLNTRTSALDVTAKRFYRLLFLGYALIVVVVASLYISVKRYGQQAEAAEAHLSQLNTELDQRVRDRTKLLKAREDLLYTFIRHVPVAVAMLDRELRYLQLSDRWCTDFGIERSRTVGALHYDLFPDIPERWKEAHRRCLAGETLRAEEDQWDRGDGKTNWMHWEIRPWGDRDGLPEGMLIFAEDITERKNIEEALRESEATTRLLLENAAQAILAVDTSGVIVMANRMVNSMFGYSPNELIGQSHGALIPAAIQARHLEHMTSFFADPTVRMMGAGLDMVGRRKDGSFFPIEVSLSTVQTQRGLLAVSFVSDITARKKAETDLKESEERLRALAGRLLTAQEEERRNLARELHDDITQRLAFLSIELGRLAKALPDSQRENRERVQALQAQTFRASSEVRRLSHGLHPSVITDFGLSVALEEFCAEFERVHEIKVHYETPAEDLRFKDMGATCLFRVAQESLKNAATHGQATRVEVTLSVQNGLIQLRIADNGNGFTMGADDAKAGLGLISMTERIRLVNGTLTVSSKPGQGTEIIATVPLTEEQDETRANFTR